MTSRESWVEVQFGLLAISTSIWVSLCVWVILNIFLILATFEQTVHRHKLFAVVSCMTAVAACGIMADTGHLLWWLGLRYSTARTLARIATITGAGSLVLGTGGFLLFLNMPPWPGWGAVGGIGGVGVGHIPIPTSEQVSYCFCFTMPLILLVQAAAVCRVISVANSLSVHAAIANHFEARKLSAKINNFLGIIIATFVLGQLLLIPTLLGPKLAVVIIGILNIAASTLLVLAYQELNGKLVALIARSK